MKKAIYLSIVIPVYNEEKNIAAVIEDHATALKNGHSFIRDWEIICLDDASTDASLALLEEMARTSPRLKIIRHDKNQGISPSFADLFAAAKGDYIYATGGDGQWPADNLIKLLDKTEETSADLTIGVRSNRRQVYGLWRNALSYGFNLLPLLIWGVDTRDANGIKLGRKEILNMNVTSTSFFAEIERIIESKRGGYKIAFVPIVFLVRAKGKAKGANWGNIQNTFKDMIAYLFRSM